jgi:beta-glucanase (GH16 family)
VDVNVCLDYTILKIQRKSNLDANRNRWIIDVEDYNGDVTKADFTVEKDARANLKRLTSGGMMLQLTPPLNKNRNLPGKGVTVSSTAYLMYGTFCAKIKSGFPGGMVTSFISMSDVKDEIDWEWVGKDLTTVQTNIFYNGIVEYSVRSGIHAVANVHSKTHEYCVNWSESKIVWTVNGKLVRTYTKESSYDASKKLYMFPNTPSRIQLGVWDGGYGSEGTRNWAGGYIDWNAVGPSGYNATIESLSIQW